MPLSNPTVHKTGINHLPQMYHSNFPEQNIWNYANSNSSPNISSMFDPHNFFHGYQMMNQNMLNNQIRPGMMPFMYQQPNANSHMNLSYKDQYFNHFNQMINQNQQHGSDMSQSNLDFQKQNLQRK